MPQPVWEQIEPGHEIPAFERTTDLAHWNRYAAVNDEFIPIHMDPADAIAAGQRDVFGMGNLRVSYLHNALRAWLGPGGDIVEFRCEFRGFNFKHDRLRSRAVATGTERRGSANLVHFELRVENQDGVDTCPGRATALLFEGGEARVLPEPELVAPAREREPGVYLDRATIEAVGSASEPAISLAVGENDIRRWAMAIHYPEQPPLEFYDESIARRGPWGGLVAPREFNPFAWMLPSPGGYPWLREIGTEPGHRVLNGGQHNLYFEPIRPGDRIEAVRRLFDVYEKRGGRTGAMLFYVTENRWTNQRGELVRLGYQTTIFY